MRTPLVAGNWKMNKTAAEARAVLSGLVPLVADSKAEVVVCPPYLAVGAAVSALDGSSVGVGAQDVFWAEAGAFTGRVSAGMLADAGVEWCIVGHSETRGKFGKLEVPETTVGFFAETDETVNLKLRALLAKGIRPILCVGETLDERNAGHTDQVIQTQLRGGLAGLSADQLAGLVIAYEPVWAIGTGQVCDTAEAERVCGMGRAEVAAILGHQAGESTRVLYGGSVKSSNSAELFGQPNIDGGLVGGASLEAVEFAKIVNSA